MVLGHRAGPSLARLPCGAVEAYVDIHGVPSYRVLPFAIPCDQISERVRHVGNHFVIDLYSSWQMESAFVWSDYFKFSSSRTSILLVVLLVWCLACSRHREYLIGRMRRKIVEIEKWKRLKRRRLQRSRIQESWTKKYHRSKNHGHPIEVCEGTRRAVNKSEIQGCLQY